MTTVAPSPGGPADLPDLADFPPMYTLQKVATTRERQLEMWKGRVLEYCRAERAWGVGLDAPVFSNTAIKRKLPHDGVRAVLQALVASGRGAWREPPNQPSPNSQPPLRDYCWVFWQPLEHWAGLVYKKVADEGNIGGVCTLFELTDDGAAGQPWEGMPEEMMMVVLKYLEKHGKAEVIHMGGDGDGVKFL